MKAEHGRARARPKHHVCPAGERGVNGLACLANTNDLATPLHRTGLLAPEVMKNRKTVALHYLAVLLSFLHFGMTDMR